MDIGLLSFLSDKDAWVAFAMAMLYLMWENRRDITKREEKYSERERALYARMAERERQYTEEQRQDKREQFGLYREVGQSLAALQAETRERNNANNRSAPDGRRATGG